MSDDSEKVSNLAAEKLEKRGRSVELESCCAAKKSKTSIECAFKSCAFSGIITPHDTPHCTVEVDLPEEDLEQFLGNSVVKWSPSGEAAFHVECWELLMHQQKNEGAAIEIGQTEDILIRNAAKMVERHDSYIALKETSARIATLVRSSKHCIALTGAAITFAGDEQEKAKMIEMDPKLANEVMNVVQTDDTSDEYGVHYKGLMPTYTHEALAKLVEVGILKFVITENGDGLHGLSGIGHDRLAELRGNVFLEICEKCDRHYYRQFYVPDDMAILYYEDLAEDGSTDVKKPKHAVKCKNCLLNHRTGRRCDDKLCRGHLQDSIINFGDDIRESVLTAASTQIKKADLILALGTAMDATPIHDLVPMETKSLQLVIVSTLKTGFDNMCCGKVEGKDFGVRVFGDCNNVMKEVMNQVLSEEQLEKWEGQQSTRIAMYKSLRDKD